MVTNYPQQLTAAAEVTSKSTTEAGLLSRMATRLGQVMCGLHGHDSVLHFEGSRVMMRCTSCQHDTPGWEISGQGPRLRYAGDARRHTLKPRLVLRKSA
jgi:NAD-dependent SIR2 family protein deacetylase